jgi:hypothetical protein
MGNDELVNIFNMVGLLLTDKKRISIYILLSNNIFYFRIQLESYKISTICMNKPLRS